MPERTNVRDGIETDAQRTRRSKSMPSKMRVFEGRAPEGVVFAKNTPSGIFHLSTSLPYRHKVADLGDSTARDVLGGALGEDGGRFAIEKEDVVGDAEEASNVVGDNN
jgi:hypothetical protein